MFVLQCIKNKDDLTKFGLKEKPKEFEWGHVFKRKIKDIDQKLLDSIQFNEIAKFPIETLVKNCGLKYDLEIKEKDCNIIIRLTNQLNNTRAKIDTDDYELQNHPGHLDMHIKKYNMLLENEVINSEHLPLIRGFFKIESNSISENELSLYGLYKYIKNQNINNKLKIYEDFLFFYKTRSGKTIHLGIPIAYHFISTIGGQLKYEHKDNTIITIIKLPQKK
ncbi:hypothetical protein MHK_009661 [Candidatus Magnetomorum sp. HK-1]|nr:hypothetical protein MHK_009661 [Candidatus Magnetomorum sp. HK-1]